MPDARDFAIGEHFVEDAPVVTALRFVEAELAGDFSAAEWVITGSGEECLDFLANVRSHEFHDNTDTAARQEKNSRQHRRWWGERQRGDLLDLPLSSSVLVETNFSDRGSASAWLF